MQRTFKYIGWPTETEKPQDINNNKNSRGQARKTNKTETHKTKRKPKTEKHHQKTETQIPKRK